MQEQELSSPDVNELNRIKTILMLYEGASNFTKIARKKMEVGDSIGRSHYIGKTSAIIRELSNSLTMDGGDISRNLRNLYDFVHGCLHKAETQNDTKALDEAEKVIEILRSAWKELSSKN
ncbi:MAG: flagellar export chaperone FliS [Nitrospiraceae bacterium]|nr:MAG: flagellar export chaperone FliS [Nitrospiraceae bacterium]